MLSAVLRVVKKARLNLPPKKTSPDRSYLQRQALKHPWNQLGIQVKLMTMMASHLRCAVSLNVDVYRKKRSVLQVLPLNIVAGLPNRERGVGDPQAMRRELLQS
jgi:hypothetical protein